MSAQPQGFTQGSVRAGAQGRSGGRGKPFFLMSEFLTLIALIVALLIAASVDDDLGATLIWPLITVLGFGYILSRGLAKRGGTDSSELSLDR
jgi:di/tricarboxylate transporter